MDLTQERSERATEAIIADPRSRPAATALLLVGAIPLAVLTWWSILTPLVPSFSQVSPQ
jgi:hypothetical protein